MMQHIFTLLVFLSVTCTVNSQVLSTNAEGKKIVKFSDGSWRYFDAEKDAHLLENQETSGPQNIEAYTDELLTALESEIKDLEVRVDEKRREESEAEKRMAQIKNANNADATAYQIAVNALTTASEETKKYKDLLSTAKSLFVNLSVIKDQNDISIKENLRSLKLLPTHTNEPNAEAVVKERLYLDVDYSGYSGATASEGPTPSSEEPPSLHSERKETDKELQNEREENPRVVSSERQSGGNEINYSGGRSKKAIETFSAVPKNTNTCLLVYDQIDEYTEKKKTEVQGDILINYTPDRLQSYYSNRDLVKATPSLSFSQGVYILKLEIEIASRKAGSSFAGISKGAQMGIKFLDGSTLNLRNSKSNRGKVNQSKETTTYVASFYLDKKAFRELSHNLIDEIRIIWRTGYEVYPVYHVDALVHLTSCLDSHI